MKKIVAIILGLSIAITPIQAGYDYKQNTKLLFKHALSSNWENVFEMLDKNPDLIKQQYNYFGNLLSCAIVFDRVEQATRLVSEFNANPHEKWRNGSSLYKWLEQKSESFLVKEVDSLALLERSILAWEERNNYPTSEILFPYSLIDTLRNMPCSADGPTQSLK